MVVPLIPRLQTPVLSSVAVGYSFTSEQCQKLEKLHSLALPCSLVEKKATSLAEAQFIFVCSSVPKALQDQVRTIVGVTTRVIVSHSSEALLELLARRSKKVESEHRRRRSLGSGFNLGTFAVDQEG